jgi:phosphatidylethanolamine/phosphatidyl-N-methylethanolamine N-methyltransferase
MPRFKPFGPTFRTERSPQVWLNIPPASVWVYQAAATHSPPQETGRHNPAQAFFERLRRGTEKIQIDLQREIDGAKARFAPMPRFAPKAPSDPGRGAPDREPPQP